MANDQSQPSREDFDAAAQRVLASAPPGLSREDFFALIDQELAKSKAPIVNAPMRTPNPVPGFERTAQPPAQNELGQFVGRIMGNLNPMNLAEGARLAATDPQAAGKALLDRIAQPFHEAHQGNLVPALADATTMLLPSAAAGAREPIGHGITASGDLLKRFSKSRAADYGSGFGAYHQFMSGNVPAAIAAASAPALANATGSGLQIMGRMISGDAPSALSAADIASLQHQGYSPEVIAKINAGASGSSPMAAPSPSVSPRAPEIVPTPPAAPVRPAPPPISVNASSLPDSWKPFVNTFKGSNPQLNGTLRPFLTADKVIAIRDLMKQGLSPEDAYAKVTRGLTPAEELSIRR